MQFSIPVAVISSCSSLYEVYFRFKDLPMSFPLNSENKAAKGQPQLVMQHELPAFLVSSSLHCEP